jgi:hypothetical protein
MPAAGFLGAPGRGGLLPQLLAPSAKELPHGADIGICRDRDFLVAEPGQRIEHGHQDADVESRIDGRGQLE